MNVLVSAAVFLVSQFAIASVDEVKIVSANEVPIVAKVMTASVRASNTAFVDASILEVRKMLTEKKVKKIGPSISYWVQIGDQRTTYAGHIVAEDIQVASPYVRIKIPGGAALQTIVRGPHVEIPAGLNAMIKKLNETPYLKDIKKTYFVAYPPSKETKGQLVTQITGLVQDTRKR